MDTTDISLPVHLRVWHALGINLVFLPSSRKSAPAFEAETSARKAQREQKPASTQPECKPQKTDVQSESLTFPPLWQKRLEKLNPPHPQLWTYWELPADIEQVPDPNRRHLWRNILAALKWPAGTIAFWPMSSFEGGLLKPNFPAFWSGVQIINPRIIVCFGHGAFCRLFPERTFQYGYFNHNNLQILTLPGPGDMLPDNKTAKKVVWNFLSSIST